ncbi:MAG: DUF1800 domain-containing protein [Proteobacteria bacterium]|nr:DUF1800 domain-containing protein [Pseudomonadota bacterium]
MKSTDAEVLHLMRRTGFGVPTMAEFDAFAALAYDEAVALRLDSIRPVAHLDDPEWLDTLPERAPSNYSPERRQQLQRERRAQGRRLKAWWYSEMLHTPSPFTERMVLFWHGHFTSSLQKVRVPELMFAQNMLFRRHATGNFAALLREVSKDPAMMVYLDTNSNTRTAPNENYARELMELFTLGEGQGYTENDVVEAARALTGWRYLHGRGFRISGGDRDIGQKTILGRTGRFDGDDLIDILLDQPRLAEHITERLWLEFVSATPDMAEVRRLAADFRESGYEIRPLLHGLLMTAAFRDPANRGTMVKSPTDLIVGTLRLVRYRPTEEPMGLANIGRTLGQELFEPPNVKGWPGGLAWIDTSLLPERYSFLTTVAQVGDALGMMAAPPPRLDSQARRAVGGMQLADVDREDLQALVHTPPAQLAELVLPLPPSGGGDGVLGARFLDPAFQLK